MKITPALILLMASATLGVCQNALQFTSVNATPQKSIILHWQSNTNEYYGIEYADSLVDTNTGTTTWTPLYDEYPSQGTNTFWQDVGNDFLNVTHPRNTDTRFYRVVYQGTNTLNDGLTVTISGLTNGSVVSGKVTVTVTAATPLFLTGLSLYLDGKELPLSLDGTNFTFNTCESWNGTHTLFATAESQSGLSGFREDAAPTFNRVVSPPVNISIQNLITDFYHSQGFFQPSLGQTQQVSANFTANCDWTLQIFDSSSNAVKTVTGNGKGMNFLWDGTDDGGTNVSADIYTYLLSASTNAASPMGLIASPIFSVSKVKTLWAVQDGTENPVPLAIFPIGFDTNTLTIFSASQEEINELIGDTDLETFSEESGGFAEPDGLGGAGTNQSTDFSAPVEKKGTVGIAYQTYAAQISTTRPLSRNPNPTQKYVAIDGDTSHSSNAGQISFPVLTHAEHIAEGFSYCMAMFNGYLTTTNLSNDEVTTNDLRKTSIGGNSILNNVNFGFLLLHGSYALTPEIDGVYYTYLWVENRASHSVGYMHLSDLSFGGGEPDGLRWMTIAGCGVLNQTCYDSMTSNSKTFINSNLHVLLGASTTMYDCPALGINYAIALSQTNSVINAWINSGIKTFLEQPGTNILGHTVKFATVAHDNCVGDTLKSYASSPSGGLVYNEQQIYPQ